MGLQYFYHPAEKLKGTFCLSPEESFHCNRVCRLRPGDEIGVLNGLGLRARAQITNTGNSVEVRVIEDTLERFPPPPPRRLFISPLQAPDRMEWLTEKATELGATEIVWTLCRRTVKKHVRTDRLERIAITAIKQSGRPFLPRIAGPTALNEIPRPEGLSCLAACEGAHTPLTTLLADKLLPGIALNLFIGPEGDFTPDEIQLALQNGFRLITLGPWRLRSETAAIAALAHAALQSDT